MIPTVNKFGTVSTQDLLGDASSKGAVVSTVSRVDKPAVSGALSGLKELPRELKLEISSHVKDGERKNLEKVNSEWRNLVRGDTTELAVTRQVNLKGALAYYNVGRPLEKVTFRPESSSEKSTFSNDDLLLIPPAVKTLDISNCKNINAFGFLNLNGHGLEKLVAKDANLQFLEARQIVRNLNVRELDVSRNRFMADGGGRVRWQSRRNWSDWTPVTVASPQLAYRISQN